MKLLQRSSVLSTGAYSKRTATAGNHHFVIVESNHVVSKEVYQYILELLLR